MEEVPRVVWIFIVVYFYILLFQTVSFVFTTLISPRIVHIRVGHDLNPIVQSPYKPNEYAKNLTIVSACSEPFFDRLENLIGSVHQYEPGMKIAVYDLGLAPWQVQTLQFMKDIHVLNFNLENYPAHVKNLENYAWKFAVVKEAYDSFGNILYLDSGQELRSNISYIYHQIMETGYFFTLQKTLINNFTKIETYERLNISRESMAGINHCAGGTTGWSASKKDAINQVLLPTFNCSMDETCISPPGANISNHKFDQSVLSIVLNNAGYHCNTNEAYFSDFLTKTPPITPLLFSRRWHCPKPYAKVIRYSDRPGILLLIKAILTSRPFVPFQVPCGHPPRNIFFVCFSISSGIYFVFFLLFWLFKSRKKKRADKQEV